MRGLPFWRLKRATRRFQVQRDGLAHSLSATHFARRIVFEEAHSGTPLGSTCASQCQSVSVPCPNGPSENAQGLDGRFQRLETRHAGSRLSDMSRPNCQTFCCLRRPSARLSHLANRKTKISSFPNSTRFEPFGHPVPATHRCSFAWAPGSYSCHSPRTISFFSLLFLFVFTPLMPA